MLKGNSFNFINSLSQNKVYVLAKRSNEEIKQIKKILSYLFKKECYDSNFLKKDKVFLAMVNHYNNICEKSSPNSFYLINLFVDMNKNYYSSKPLILHHIPFNLKSVSLSSDINFFNFVDKNSAKMNEFNQHFSTDYDVFQYNLFEIGFSTENIKENQFRRNSDVEYFENLDKEKIQRLGHDLLYYLQQKHPHLVFDVIVEHKKTSYCIKDEKLTSNLVLIHFFKLEVNKEYLNEIKLKEQYSKINQEIKSTIVNLSQMLSTDKIAQAVNLKIDLIEYILKQHKNL